MPSAGCLRRGGGRRGRSLELRPELGSCALGSTVGEVENCGIASAELSTARREARSFPHLDAKNLTLLNTVLPFVVVGGARDSLYALIVVVLSRGALLRVCAFWVEIV